MTIGQDDQGRLWSEHNLTRQNLELSSTLPNGGVPQIAQALLTEALRREIYCGILAKMSRDPELLTRWASSEEAKKAVEIEMANAAVVVMNRSVVRMALPMTTDMLGMMSAEDG